MNETTGSYICIGVISYEDEFKEKVVRLVNFLDKFWCDRIDFPKDICSFDYVKNQRECCCVENMVDCCIRNHMIQARGGFNLEEYEIKNVLFRVESLPNNKKCFLIEMPEQQNSIFEDIDKAEEVIIHFFENISQFHFLYGFCDNEAEPEDECGYSIYVEYDFAFKIFFQPWKIDGLTGRS